MWSGWQYASGTNGENLKVADIAFHQRVVLCRAQGAMETQNTQQGSAEWEMTVPSLAEKVAGRYAGINWGAQIYLLRRHGYRREY